jgi:phosphoribosyl 1,2-cyclic phosphate phosphodiesterase
MMQGRGRESTGLAAGISRRHVRAEFMAADFELTFLGTGTSVGVPVIGCRCRVCTSPDPRNKRTRSSIHVRHGDVSLLVDSGPDLREQALREDLTKVDAVLYTHSHVDHVVGFDELRAFCWHRDEPLPLHATADCMDTLKTMFAWAFSAANVYPGYIKPAPHVIGGPMTFGALTVTPLPVEHARTETVGFLFEAEDVPSVAYIPDAKRVPEESMALLERAQVLIIDALRPLPHPTHLSTEEALEVIQRAGVAQAWLTHLGHDNDHHELEATLPQGVRVAYDGLRIRA